MPPRPLARRTWARARGCPATLGPATVPSAPFLPFLSFFLPLSSFLAMGVSRLRRVTAGASTRRAHAVEHVSDKSLAVVLVDLLELQRPLVVRADADHARHALHG